MENAQFLEKSSQWHLLGAGSLGCLFAAYLQHAGVALEIIVRDAATLQTLNENGGITLTEDTEHSTIAIAATIPHTLDAPITQLLICTKAQQTLAAIDSVKHRLATDSLIILLQNGMGVRELLQQQFPHATILHALSTEGAFRTARFHVTHAGHGETVIGAIEAQQQILAKKTVNALQCKLPIVFVPDIERRLWLKLAVNSVINPLTALHRCRNGELLKLDDIDSTIENLYAELALVTQIENIDVDVKEMRDEVYRVIHATAQNKSSMLQDIEAGRASEIDFINGFIVQRAHAHGLECEQHEHLLAMIHAASAPAPAP